MSIKTVVLNDIHILETEPEDLQHIMDVEEAAFNSKEEAQLAANLLQDESAKPLLSLKAVYNSKTVGHILFTRVNTKKDSAEAAMYILAPMGVDPEYQNNGIGGALIRRGLDNLRNNGAKAVFVLGPPDYYAKHGFSPDAKKKGFEAPFSIPEKNKDAWMYQFLTKDAKYIENGKIICADSLMKPEYWKE